MESAIFPENEERRLAELLSYEVLDTDCENVFDQLTQLASEICQTPIALISLIDHDRQWFKSRVGLDAQQTHRDLAFCAHAILKDEFFEVEDASKDNRFHDNPLVTDSPDIRFYAGTPLISPRGYALGTLCAIDTQPRKLTESQKTALKTLGNAVIAQLELKRKARDLEHVNQFKNHFMSYVSHEVRTPLNAISMFSTSLLKEARKYDLPPHFSTNLKHIQTSGERLLDIVDSVLDVKQIEKGQLKLISRSVETHLYLTGFFSMLSAVNASAAQLEWQISGVIPQTIIVDDTKLSQIMTTLVNHSLKQAAAGTCVSCTTRINSQRLELSLTGPETIVSQEEARYLQASQISFDDTFYVDEAFVDLSICKNLLSVLNGSLTVHKAETGQVTLQLTVPLGTAGQGEQVFTREEDEPLAVRSGVSLLVVEDNEINQIVIASLLSEMNLTFYIVDSGESCLAFLSERSVDLVIMDIGLPGISGVQATQAIKQDTPHLPVIALTADVVTDRKDLLSSGLNAVLTKPIATNHLVRMLNRYLGEE